MTIPSAFAGTANPGNSTVAGACGAGAAGFLYKKFMIKGELLIYKVKIQVFPRHIILKKILS